jgi:N-acetylmuramoyl-L-alanine amidase
LPGVYGGVVLFLLGRFLYQLLRLSRLKNAAPQRHMDDITLINTDTPGTPFSFFHWIFWDNQLPLESEAGGRIFRHELAHVRRGHSLDKIALQILCTFFFPVFPLYFIRRELQLVHEYQADYEATGRRDIDAYAAYLLQHALNDRAFDLSNAFHQHPLVRRIAMLNNFLLPQGKASSWRKWMALPLLGCAICLFAFTIHKTAAVAATPQDNARVLTVVIDAGHGGNDPGAKTDAGLREKDIALDLAKTVATLAPGYPVQILLSRDADTFVPLQNRVLFSDEHRANLFVSLHVNFRMTALHSGGHLTYVPDSLYSGIETYVSEKNRFFDSSKVLGSILQQHLAEVYPAEAQLRERSAGIRVLSMPSCPAVLIECGYLSNPKDAAFISDTGNQEKLARKILESLVAYGQGNNPTYQVLHTKGG